MRRSLEKFHTGGPNPEAVKTAWQHLKSPDRFIRYAARLALEHQPVAEWQDLALKEKDPVALTQSLISLIRMGDGSKKNDILNALLSVNFKALPESQKLDLLRAFELAFLRMGQPDAALKSKVIAYLNPLYPANTAHLNRSLCKVLVYLDAPEAVSKTLALMDIKTEPGSDALNVETATASSDLILRNPQYGNDIAAMLANVPPAQHTWYAVMLSLAKEGWTPALQDKYFKWYYDAFGYKGGRSYVGFLDRSLKLALKNVPENKRAYFEKLAGTERLSKNGNDLISATAPKGPGRFWRMENAYAAIEKGLTDRNFENGKAMYAATTCKMCHTMKGEGGAIGPDLSQLYTRFSSKDMLEAIIIPDKTVSDQYAAMHYDLKKGGSIVGRLINEDNTAYYISQNPYAPNEIEKVLKKNVLSAKPSSASIMFGGLINSLNEEELKDLMAYLMSGANENNAMFKK